MTRASAPGWRHSRHPERILLICIALAANPVLAQTTSGRPNSEAAAVDVVQQAAVRAMNFTQGDLASLEAAQSDFTPEGWRVFMRSLEGSLDDKGAPQFSSEFVPSGSPFIFGQGNGTIHLSIPGTLTQTRNKSSTRYRNAALDVEARGIPPKIDHLEQKTCVGLPSGSSCR